MQRSKTKADLVQYFLYHPITAARHFITRRFCDHALEGWDKAYRRYDTLEAPADIARRDEADMNTGVIPAARQQPLLQVVA